MASDKASMNLTILTSSAGFEGPDATQTNTSTPENHKPVILPLRQSWLSIVFFVLALGPVIGLGYTCYAPIAFNVATELDDPSSTQWCLNAWTLASSFSFLFCGYISDLCGRRNILLCGSFVAILGFVTCSVAHSIGTLLAGQTLLGVSVGFLFVVYSATAEIVPRSWCPIAIGVIECGFMIPWGSFAVLIANSLLVRSTWRWIFYIGIILETSGFIGIFCFYRPKHNHHKVRSVLEILQGLDYVGLTLFTGGLTSVLIGLMRAGTPSHVWNSVGVIVPLVIGVASLTGAVLWDALYACTPVMSWWLLRQFRTFGTLTLVSFTNGIVFFPMLSWIPQGLSVIFSNDPIKVGVLSLPSTLGQGIGLLLGLLLIRKLGHFKHQLVFLLTFQMVFKAAAIASLNPNNKFAFVFLPALGLSTFGWQTMLNITLLSSNVPHSILGTAIALNSSMRTAGGSVGGAVFKVIFYHVYDSDVKRSLDLVMAEADLPSYDWSPVLAACLYRDFGALSKLIGNQSALLDHLVKLVRQAFGHALQMVFVAAAAVSVSGLILALFVQDKPLRARDRKVSAEGGSL